MTATTLEYWRQHPTNQQLYGQLPPITKTIKFRRTRQAETSSKVMFSYRPLHLVELKQGDQLEPIYSSSVRIRDIALRIRRKRWTIGRISVLVALQNDDDDIHTYNIMQIKPTHTHKHAHKTVYTILTFFWLFFDFFRFLLYISFSAWWLSLIRRHETCSCRQTFILLNIYINWYVFT